MSERFLTLTSRSRDFERPQEIEVARTAIRLNGSLPSESFTARPIHCLAALRGGRPSTNGKHSTRDYAAVSCIVTKFNWRPRRVENRKRARYLRHKGLKLVHARYAHLESLLR
jgi:hypothetical protein